MRYSWTFEEVDAKLKGIMEGIFEKCDSAWDKGIWQRRKLCDGR